MWKAFIIKETLHMVINTPFILASKSLSRKKILKNNGLNFKQIKPTCNEEFYKKYLLKKKKSPAQIAKKLSILKYLFLKFIIISSTFISICIKTYKWLILL